VQTGASKLLEFGFSLDPVTKLLPFLEEAKAKVSPFTLLLAGCHWL
jgi:hypothetical protein